MRALRILLIIAVVLGGIFVAADRLAVNFAEGEAADKIKSSQGLSGNTDVSIKGFPFLTQVAGNQLDEVEVNLDSVEASAGGRQVTITSLSAQLHDVKLSNSYSSATAARATGTAHISYEDLSKASSEGVTVGYGGTDKAGKSQVKVTASVVILGQEIERSVYSTVSIVGGDTIRLHAEKVPAQGIPGLEDKIREQIDFDRPISGLPRGIKLDQVQATEDGVDISVTGTNVELAG